MGISQDVVLAGYSNIYGYAQGVGEGVFIRVTKVWLVRQLKENHDAGSSLCYQGYQTRQIINPSVLVAGLIFSSRV